MQDLKGDTSRRLLDWYDRHHRELPWRTNPAEGVKGMRTDPYRVWLSEVMLQQTTVQAVKAYFDRFTRTWPTVRDLAAAPVEEVMSAWAGLGYYARARNLKKCAEAVASGHGGQFPDTEEALRALPGIGAYTAAAIAAIAFNRKATVVDGNVERVVTRLFAIDTPLPAAKPEIRARTGDMVPDDRPGDFAQAMMDLGATICTPRRPACVLCPLKEECRALKEGDPELYPVKAARKDKPVRVGAAFVAVGPGQQVFLRRRPESGLLGGMTEVPGTGWTARLDGETGVCAAPFAADWQSAGTITHVFTHFELRLSIYRADMKICHEADDGWWQPVEKLDRAALPTVMKKAIAAAIPDAMRMKRKGQP
ncbi:A/G-specific adenine glycosylase [Gellertiella hungarica]|uniref:Adenine DNA glycosylase n=1 Tax=Gellertiella hungarica TaxID=1572859 RepID=A0A7W6J473_9HYPH|nr:A/G-specific adenine glycosylase [Gellertiella hungarica]MBB4064470.1 A/G-specific adenine glycosylase [Gellertiella hungarica]